MPRQRRQETQRTEDDEWVMARAVKRVELEQLRGDACMTKKRVSRREMAYNGAGKMDGTMEVVVVDGALVSGAGDGMTMMAAWDNLVGVTDGEATRAKRSGPSTDNPTKERSGPVVDQVERSIEGTGLFCGDQGPTNPGSRGLQNGRDWASH